jgi:hypothetical protein
MASQMYDRRSGAILDNLNGINNVRKRSNAASYLSRHPHSCRSYLLSFFVAHKPSQHVVHSVVRRRCDKKSRFWQRFQKLTENDNDGMRLPVPVGPQISVIECFIAAASASFWLAFNVGSLTMGSATSCFSCSASGSPRTDA